MNLAIAPNTPIARSVPLTRPAVARPTTVGNTFAACFGKKLPKVEDIESYTHWTKEDAVYGNLNPKFEADMRAGIEEVMQGLPKNLTTELLEKGLTINTANTLAVMEHPSLLHPDYAQSQLALVNKGLLDIEKLSKDLELIVLAKYLYTYNKDGDWGNSDENLTECLSHFGKLNQKDIERLTPPSNPAVLQSALQMHNIAQQLKGASPQPKQIIELDAYLLNIARMKSSIRLASFENQLRTIWTHGNLSENTGEVDYPPSELVTPRFRHEVWHAIEHLSRSKIKLKQPLKALSEHPVYRKLLALDQTEAIESGAMQKAYDSGMRINTFNITPYTDLEKEEQWHYASEAFVEIGAALTGGDKRS